MPAKRQRNTVCVFCAEGVEEVTFRDTEVLQRFISGQSKILPRKKTGSCAKHQRRIAREIKRAREMGMLSYRGQ
jgi:small subunit ribosomal protein S18